MQADRSRRPVYGLSVLVLIVVAVGVWLFLNRAEARPPVVVEESAEAPLPLARLGLPDDSLLGFIEIPAGEFVMGSDPAMDPGAFENEFWGEDGGQGIVTLPTYFLGRTEVTEGQYSAFIEDTGRQRADSTGFTFPDDFPATQVSWPEALAYGRWLTRQLLASPQTPQAIRSRLDQGWRITLPTEAEWEKGARGPSGRIFPWGDQPRRGLANFGSAGPQAVGRLPCDDCAYGLLDMAGNVWEWTRSPYVPYPYDPDRPTIDLQSDALWVMKGGGYSDGLQLLRGAARGAADPGARRPFIGFRLALTPP